MALPQKHFNSAGLGMASISIIGGVPTTGGALAAIPNIEGAKIIILRAFLHVKTPSTGAANLSVGVAADAVTSATDIINALAVNGAITGKTYTGFAVVVAAKTEQAVPALWTTDKFITVTGSADTTGLDATLYLEYIREGDAES